MRVYEALMRESYLQNEFFIFNLHFALTCCSSPANALMLLDEEVGKRAFKPFLWQETSTRSHGFFRDVFNASFLRVCSYDSSKVFDVNSAHDEKTLFLGRLILHSCGDAF